MTSGSNASATLLSVCRCVCVLSRTGRKEKRQDFSFMLHPVPVLSLRESSGVIFPLATLQDDGGGGMVCTQL